MWQIRYVKLKNLFRFIKFTYLNTFMLLSKLISILCIVLIIAGCDDSRSNNQNLNISIKAENLSKENQNIYSKIQENGIPPIP